ncbi:hypothetical protein H072_5814 [Dactylellina haptotyla CBS 200.50]|uniref:Uncharacterized protein n=1 Tax=Dactylellina haptotyla (strain CBS 200.50) TaxID=1284197 RepID=S8ABN9_DACHA|nr:hypothetical protein H072_5814 [Dactylellina haptotyla CBS 200.50]
MPGPTTIAEALQTLPSSSTFFASAAGKPQTGRRLLVTKKKFGSSASAEHHKPPKLQWVSQQAHILPSDGTSTSTPKRKKGVKEAFLIAGRDSGVKQSLTFSCRLPLPFLEQNGPHDEDIEMDLDEHSETTYPGGAGLTAGDLEMYSEPDDESLPSGGGGGSGGGGLTAAFLEDLESEGSAPSGMKSQSTTHMAKRRRVDPSRDEPDECDSLPRDFLELLKSEVPGGKKNVSPGEFARVWKMSGRKMGNEMVLAQNQYFNSIETHDSPHKRKGRGKGR